MIETDRLILRPFEPSDLDAIAAIITDIRTRKFLGARPHPDPAEWLREATETHERTGIGFMPVVARETNALVGYAGLRHMPYDLAFTPAVDIGWTLAFDHWGKGYATEAALGWLRYGFTELELDKIVACAAAANAASHAVMERLGMRRNPAFDFDHPRAATEPPPSRRQWFYSMSRQQWLAGT